MIIPKSDKNCLTDDEEQELRRDEATIERLRQTNWEAGLALCNIRNKRLYRAQYATFDDYCRSRWNMERTYAHRLIEAVRVRQVLLPTGNILPTNERQTRPLTKLKHPEQIQQAWLAALEVTSGNPTAVAVEKAVQEIKGVKPKKSRKQHQLPQLVQEPDDSHVEVDDTTFLDNPLVSAGERSNWNRQQGILIYQLNIRDTNLGGKIAKLARERGKQPETIVAFGIEALEAMPEKEERITELIQQVRALVEQVSLVSSHLEKSSKTVSVLESTGRELERVVEQKNAENALLKEILKETENHCTKSASRIGEIDNELASSAETVVERIAEGGDARTVEGILHPRSNTIQEISPKGIQSNNGLSDNTTVLANTNNAAEFIVPLGIQEVVVPDSQINPPDPLPLANAERIERVMEVEAATSEPVQVQEIDVEPKQLSLLPEPEVNYLPTVRTSATTVTINSHPKPAPLRSAGMREPVPASPTSTFEETRTLEQLAKQFPLGSRVRRIDEDVEGIVVKHWESGRITYKMQSEDVDFCAVEKLVLISLPEENLASNEKP